MTVIVVVLVVFLSGGVVIETSVAAPDVATCRAAIAAVTADAMKKTDWTTQDGEKHQLLDVEGRCVPVDKGTLALAKPFSPGTTD